MHSSDQIAAWGVLHALDTSYISAQCVCAHRHASVGSLHRADRQSKDPAQTHEVVVQPPFSTHLNSETRIFHFLAHQRSSPQRVRILRWLAGSTQPPTSVQHWPSRANACCRRRNRERRQYRLLRSKNRPPVELERTAQYQNQ